MIYTRCSNLKYDAPSELCLVLGQRLAVCINSGLQGTWDFTERARQSIQQEETLIASKAAKLSAKKQPLPHPPASERPLSNSLTIEVRAGL